MCKLCICICNRTGSLWIYYSLHTANCTLHKPHRTVHNVDNMVKYYCTLNLSHSTFTARHTMLNPRAPTQHIHTLNNKVHLHITKYNCTLLKHKHKHKHKLHIHTCTTQSTPAQNINLHNTHTCIPQRTTAHHIQSTQHKRTFTPQSTPAHHMNIHSTYTPSQNINLHRKHRPAHHKIHTLITVLSII